MNPDLSPPLSGKKRWYVIASALLALFLGAMDALVMTAAMPTIVAELGDFSLYSWVYSAYFLARAVSLPIFGKLADIHPTRRLFTVSILIFLLSSVIAGCASNMILLVIARVFQGIGAGGNFALVYIALADISAPGKRARVLSLASFVWGIASVLGPTAGGFIVSYLSWRWIFFINIPLGIVSLLGIWMHMVELRDKKRDGSIDLAGAVTLTGAILGVLTLFLLGGRDYAWTSLPIGLLIGFSMLACAGFFLAEKRAKDPILALHFFKIRGFSIGNGSVFLSSFVIFSLFAYAPLFIQGALGKSPVQVGVAMLSLSLGWSLGSLGLGQVSHRLGLKNAAILGALCLVAAGAMTLTFSKSTTMTSCFWVFQLAGIGMGLVTLSTLLVVQNAMETGDLGVATASHQFARTMGGTVGVGICGSLVTARLTSAIRATSATESAGLSMTSLTDIANNVESLFRPEVLSRLPAPVQHHLQQAVVDGVAAAFWVVLAAALICSTFCLLLPRESRPR